jgi:hypothetical protein
LAFAGRIDAAPVLLLVNDVGAAVQKNVTILVVSLTFVDDVGGVVRKRLTKG